MSSCECYAILTDPKRKALYEGIFPEGKVPITPKEGTGRTDAGEVFDFWLLDTTRVNSKQLAEIHRAVSQAFGIPLPEIIAEGKAHGYPVNKRGAEFHFCRNHLRYGDNVFDPRGFM